MHWSRVNSHKEYPSMHVNYLDPKPFGQSQRYIADLAKDVATNTEYAPGNDLIAFVEKVGGRVIYQELRELNKSDSASILVEPDARFVITLPNHTTAKRDRFTIAHEIGHLVLHFLLNKTRADDEGLAASRYGSGQVEYEANWFAASFLMPEERFRQSLIDNAGSLESVANYFDVSSTAAAVRAKSLGIDVA